MWVPELEKHASELVHHLSLVYAIAVRGIIRAKESAVLVEQVPAKQVVDEGFELDHLLRRVLLVFQVFVERVNVEWIWPVPKVLILLAGNLFLQDVVPCVSILVDGYVFAFYSFRYYL